MNDLKNFSSGMPVVQQNRNRPNPLVGILFLIFIIIFALFMGISGLKTESQSLDDAFSNGLKNGTCVSGVPYMGSSNCNFEYTHKLKFIPFMHEYYFLILSEDMDTALLVRADKDFGENFDATTKRNISGTAIKGSVRTPSSKVRKYFTAMKEPMINSAYCIDLLSSEMNTRWFIIAGFNLFMMLYYIIFNKKKQNGKSLGVVGKVLGGAVIAGFCVCSYFLLCFIVQI